MRFLSSTATIMILQSVSDYKITLHNNWSHRKSNIKMWKKKREIEIDIFNYRQ